LNGLYRLKLALTLAARRKVSLLGEQYTCHAFLLQCVRRGTPLASGRACARIRIGALPWSVVIH
jgi:hypothetical protein